MTKSLVGVKGVVVWRIQSTRSRLSVRLGIWLVTVSVYPNDTNWILLVLGRGSRSLPWSFNTTQSKDFFYHKTYIPGTYFLFLVLISFLLPTTDPLVGVDEGRFTTLNSHFTLVFFRELLRFNSKFKLMLKLTFCIIHK